MTNDKPGGPESVEGRKVDLGGDGIMRFQDLAWLKNQLRTQGLHIVVEEEWAVLERSKSLLRPTNAPLPEGCYCSPGRCMAPRIMGRQMPCRRAAKGTP